MHFMNPVPVMRLIEVIQGFKTDEQTLNQILDLSKQLDKIPLLAQDYPGFVANRILLPMINEAIETLFQGIGGVYEIDHMMKLGMGHPMGPLTISRFYWTGCLPFGSRSPTRGLWSCQIRTSSPPSQHGSGWKSRDKIRNRFL